MLRVSFVTVALQPDERRITGSLLGCQRPLQLLSPPPSPERSIGGRGGRSATVNDLLREDHKAFSSFRVAVDLQQPPPFPMNYTPVIPSQRDLPQKYGAKQ